MFENARNVASSSPIGTEGELSRRREKAVAAVSSLWTDWSFIWHGRVWIGASVAAMLFLGVVIDLLAAPRYRAVSQILIGPVDLRVVEKAVIPGAQSADASVIQVESETRVLTSDKVLRRVVKSERLTDDPEFQSNSGSSLGRTIEWVRTAAGVDADKKVADRELAALRQLQRTVFARRNERTYVVDLVVESADPEKSARFANAIAQAYLDEQSAARTEAARRASESLSSRLTEMAERVRRAEELVERYKAENNIVGAGGQLVHEQQLGELNNQLGVARGRAVEAKTRYEQTRQVSRDGADPGSTTEAVQSNTIGRLREQYATVARQEANVSAQLGPRHPFAIEARAQVRDARRLIEEELRRVSEANRNDYERAMANENSLHQSLESLKQNAMETNLAFVELRELEREVDVSRAVYESFLVRARETREQEQLDTVNVRILSEAQPSQERIWPPRRLHLLLGALVAGCFGGIALAFAGDRFGRMRTRPM